MGIDAPPNCTQVGDNDHQSPQHSATERPDAPYRALVWIVALLTPVVLVLTTVRLLIFPVFLNFEYNTPNFPADTYGFTIEDRLYWSEITMDYLLNPEGISFLADLRFEDGATVYNQRELGHMVDVKNALKGALAVWRLSVGLWAWRGNWLTSYRQGLSRGGWLTVLLVAAILFFVMLSFGVFFTAFHNVFFQPGTWRFLYSDTLIRLFPERFWRDIFIYVGGLSLVGGLALGYGFRRIS